MTGLDTTFEQLPVESVEVAGQRLFREALRASGSPHYEDPETGHIYPPKTVVPGKGKVRPDGTLGPLPDDAELSTEQLRA